MAPFNHTNGKRYQGLHLAEVQRPSMWRRFLRSLELEPEDLLAIPLCLLTGLSFTVYSLGSSGLFQVVQGTAIPRANGGALDAVASWLSLPVAAVRQLLS